MSSPRITDPAVRHLADIAARLRSRYEHDFPQWQGSPFVWIKGGLPSRTKGALAEELVAEWCRSRNFIVKRSPDRECDRVIGGLRTEIKFSTLWEPGGFYKFQQFRNQRYEIAVCLGISPFNAHCWVIPKVVLLEHVIGHTPQHGGAAGSDTAWLQVVPERTQQWLVEHGGHLDNAAKVLRQLTT